VISPSSALMSVIGRTWTKNILSRSYFASHQGNLQALVELMSVTGSSRRTEVGLVFSRTVERIESPPWDLVDSDEQHKKRHRGAGVYRQRKKYGLPMLAGFTGYAVAHVAYPVAPPLA
jgi:hypothetical protein